MAFPPAQGSGGSGGAVAGLTDAANVAITGGSITGITDLAVADGGTGASTLTGLVKGNGTSAMTAVTAPAGTVVGTSDTQTLTNKTLTQPAISMLLEAFTASDTLTTAESGKLCTNTGAGATVALTLPAATGSGVYYTALVGAAQTFGFGANGTDTIQYNASVSSGGGSLTTNVVGRVVTIVDYASGKWMAKDTIGAWTTA